eukprot:1850430-Prymnesium_polylepis.1
MYLVPEAPQSRVALEYGLTAHHRPQATGLGQWLRGVSVGTKLPCSTEVKQRCVGACVWYRCA